MLRITRSFSVLILAGAIAPVAANAALLGTFTNVHTGIKEAKSGRINFTLVNKSDVSRSVTVDGKTYTLTPHQPVSVSAEPGSQVTEEDAGSATARKVLFTVDRTQKGATISIN
jgi:hypothetical protein